MHFSGWITARFEIYQQKSDEAERMLRLRVLEILTPITPNPPPGYYNPGSTISKPLPGEFLSRGRTSRPMEPWTFPLARTSANVDAFTDFLAERAIEKTKYGV